MNRKKTKLAGKRKVIRRCLTKRKGATLAELLPAAAYRRRIKELRKNNKELACALQDAKCAAVINNTMLQNYAKESNNIILARHKVKGMASTIQKLVGDLHDVLNCLDASPLRSIKPTLNNEAFRLRFLEPDLETIEESPRSSVGGEEGELLDSPLVSRISNPEWMEMTETPTLAMDTSATEIYNVNQFLSGTPEMQKDLSPINEDDADPVIQTPPPPQFDPLSYTIKLDDLAPEKREDVAQISKEAKCKASANKHLSKIPVRRPNLLHDALVHDSPEAITPALRRETFFVNPIHNRDNEYPTASDNNYNDSNTLQKLAGETDRRGTFVIPVLPPPKPANFFELPNEICADDKTVLLSEDMELTEILHTGSFQGTSKIQCSGIYPSETNTNGESSTALPSTLYTSKPPSPIKKIHPALSKAINPELRPDAKKSEQANTIVESSRVLPSILHTSKPPSPIEKFNPALSKATLNRELRPDFKKSEQTNTNAESSTILPFILHTSKPPSPIEKLNPALNWDLRPELKISDEEKTNVESSSGLPSMLHTSKPPSPTEKLNPALSETTVNREVEQEFKNIDIATKGFEVVLESKSDCPTSSEKIPVFEHFSNASELSGTLIKNVESIDSCQEFVCRTTRQSVSRKSTLPKILESSSSCSSLDLLPSDPEPEDIASEVSRKRIPGRRSLKPNRRGPYIFKNNTKRKKSIPEQKNLDSAGSKDYDFASSEEDDEEINKPKPNRKLSKKSFKTKKSKNTVAILERDIGLMYQEQGRRKRSLKRRVSFANRNMISTNSDCENKADDCEKEFETIEDGFNNDIKKTNAPVRRSILKKIPLPTRSKEEDDLTSPEDSFSCKNDCEQNSYSDSTFEINVCTNSLGKKSPSSSNSKPASSSSEKSNSKASEAGAKNSSKSEEIQKRANTVKGCVESVLETANKETDDEPLTNENESPNGPLTASSQLEKVKNKSSLKLSNTHKNSEFFGFENKSCKSKRTFSGVSERSSKKRITLTDDFLEEIDIVLPSESEKNEASASSIKTLNDHKMLKNAATGDFSDEADFESEEAKVSVFPSKSSSNAVKDIANGDVNIAAVSKACRKDVATASPPKLLNDVAQNTGEVKSEVLVSAPKSENIGKTKTPKSKKSPNAKPKKKSKFFSDIVLPIKNKKNEPSASAVKTLKDHKLLKNAASEDFLDEVDVESKEAKISVFPSKSSRNALKDIDKWLMDPVNGDTADFNIDVVSKVCRSDIAAASTSKLLNNIAQNIGEVNSGASISAPKSETTGNTKTPKSKKSSNAKPKKKSKSHIASDVLTEIKDSLNCKQSSSKKILKENIGDTPPSKARKTGSSGSLKENAIVPDLESGRRSRRSRPTINFKEPSLGKKMRRE